MKIKKIIKTNNDWMNIIENEDVIYDINNDAYFGFRAMEKKVHGIMYDPLLVKNIIRLIKESKKFNHTIHYLIFTIDTLDYKSSESEENYLKQITREIEKLLVINIKLNMKFILKTGNLNNKLIKDILWDIYKK